LFSETPADALRDAVAVHRPERVERLQHEQIERALNDVAVIGGLAHAPAPVDDLKV
jgi:hypothetical protein